MASVYETSGTFTIERLRTENPSYLQGSVRPGGLDPVPIAVCRGPRVTSSSAPGDSERWVVALTVPAAPEVAWVVISGDYFVGFDSGSEMGNSFLAMFGTIDDGADTRGPILGPGDNIGNAVFASAGEFERVDTEGVPRTNAIWVPLDPQATKNGWTPILSVAVGATAPSGADDMRADLGQVILLGYPVNAWGTSALWANLAFRGS